MSRLATQFAVSSVGLILALPIAKADMYQGTVMGTVTSDGLYGIEAGDTAEVSYLFDSDAPDSFPDDPQLGLYGLTSLTVEVGPVFRTYEGGLLSGIRVIRGSGTFHWYEVYAATREQDGSGLFEHVVTVDIIDFEDRLLSSDALPTTLDFEPSAQQLGTIDFYTVRCADFECAFESIAEADINSIGIQVIPEPGVGMLLVVEAMCVALRRRIVIGQRRP